MILVQLLIVMLCSVYVAVTVLLWTSDSFLWISWTLDIHWTIFM